MASDSKNVVHSLAKGFSVLEAFSAEDPELTLSEAARSAGLDNATTFRLLNTLVMLGYVERIGDSRRFKLTLKCLELGFNAIARMDLRTLARPVLRGLVDEINEAASLGVLDGTDVIYIERVRAGITRLGVDIRLGSRVPAYSSAIGRAILAYLPVEKQMELLNASNRVKLTHRTITGIDELLARLKATRERGYATSDQETVLGLLVVAAPVLDIDGSPIASISVTAPAIRFTLKEFLHHAQAPLLQAATHISRALQTNGGFGATVG